MLLVLKTHGTVTRQFGVQLLAAIYKHNTKICGGGTKEVFINRAQLGGPESIPAPSQPLLQSTEILMFPERLNSKPMPQSLPLLYLGPSEAQDSCTNGSPSSGFLSLWCTLVGFSLAMASHSSLSLSWAWGALPDHSRRSCRTSSIRDTLAPEAAYTPGAEEHSQLMLFTVLLPASTCCSQAKGVEAVHDPRNVLHGVVVSQELVPSEAHLPAWDSTSVSRLPQCVSGNTVRGLSSKWAQHLPARWALRKHMASKTERLLCVFCFEVPFQNPTAVGVSGFSTNVSQCQSCLS